MYNKTLKRTRIADCVKTCLIPLLVLSKNSIPTRSRPEVVNNTTKTLWNLNGTQMEQTVVIIILIYIHFQMFILDSYDLLIKVIIKRMVTFGNYRNHIHSLSTLSLEIDLRIIDVKVK